MLIAINVDGAGNIGVNPTLAICKQSEQVTWESGGTSLTLTFKDQSPFSTMQVAGGAAASATIRADAPKGVSYHYSVAVLVGGTIYTIPGCPEIIVQ